jgi:AraC-like DNA-binding protein
MSHGRIEEANTRLRESNDPITVIAHDVGYATLGALERAFKPCQGMTARAFKEEVRPS